MRYITAFVLALIASALALTTAPALAQPPIEGHHAPFGAANPGYTLHYSFSADPKDNTYVASFTPDVKSIYAWATVTQDNGAAEKQFQVDIQFVAPNGQTIKSKWYGNDTGNVTTYPDTATSFGDVNVARRQLDIAGTPDAGLTGQWTVNFLANGKLVIAGNFSLAGSNDLASNDAAANGRSSLEAAGYTVTDFGQDTSKNTGKLIAFVSMKMESKDLYSSQSSQQVVDGFTALRRSYPQADSLLNILEYSAQYDLVFSATGSDVDSYLSSSDFNKFSQAIALDVFDKNANQYLSTSKDFLNKNFGAGTPESPVSGPTIKQTTVGSVRVEIKPSTVPADGSSTADVKVTVYDKRNKPVPNADVEFGLTGSGSGTIRPKITSSDTKGEAVATFSAGTKSGTINVTATVSGTIGSGVITVGQGSADPAKDNVTSYLAAQGYEVADVGFADDAHTTAVVIIDLGNSFKLNQIGLPVLYGLTALRKFYPDATKLGVFIPYQTNYLVFPSSSTAFDDFDAKLSAAADADKTQVIKDYLGDVLDQSSLVDPKGNRISTFQDFVNKNFGAG